MDNRSRSGLSACVLCTFKAMCSSVRSCNGSFFLCYPDSCLKKKRPTKAKNPWQISSLRETMSELPSAVSPPFISTFHWTLTFKTNSTEKQKGMGKHTQHHHCWLWYNTLQMWEFASFLLCVLPYWKWVICKSSSRYIAVTWQGKVVLGVPIMYFQIILVKVKSPFCIIAVVLQTM